MTPAEIDQLEAGGILDCLIAEKVLGLKRCPQWEARDGCWMGEPYYAYNATGELYGTLPEAERPPQMGYGDYEPIRPMKSIVGRGGPGEEGWYAGWSPSTNLDAAVEATEALAPSSLGKAARCPWSFRLLRDHNAGYWVDVWTVEESFLVQAHAPTAALALCRALLKAVLSAPPR